MTTQRCIPLALLGLTMLSGSAAARSTPAATLLIPYFEVDLEDPEGRNSLFSIGNATQDPILAHVVLWTDWSAPTLAFDLLLRPEELRSVNLRQLFADGFLPSSGHDPDSVSSFPACASPLALPVLDPQALATLAAQHTGQPHPVDERCYGSQRGDSSLVVGFATVDVVNDCSSSLQYPYQPGYFLEGGTGLASNQNALWGDLFLLDAAEASAQGVGAVAIRATPENSGPTARTFYRNFSIQSSQVGPEDGREAVACRSRSRFLNGGAFDGGTDLLVWTELSERALEGRDCTLDANDPLTVAEMIWRNEAGQTVDTTVVQTDATAWRVHVGDQPAWTPGIPFGTVEVHAAERSFWWNPPSYTTVPVQSLVLPVYRASGLYSVALESVSLDGGCE